MKYSKSTGGFYTSETHGDNIPKDAVSIAEDEHRRLLDGQSVGKRISSDENGFPILTDPPAFTDAQLIEIITISIQNHLDSVAKSRKYDNILSLCSYVGSPSPKYDTEGRAGIKWRDQTWSQAEQIMEDVLSGSRAIPTVEQVLAELPVIDW